MNSRIYYWPTILWGLGFAEYLLQIVAYPHPGKFLGISVFLSLAILFFAAFENRKLIKNSGLELWAEFKSSPLLFKFFVTIIVGLLFIAGIESHLPPRLLQESDALTYHMTLARQHLLMGSLVHISWSAADLWPMTIQWGFAPFWFMFNTFNKIPQFVTALWVVLLGISLGREIFRDYRGWLPALAFISTHGVMIQLGTAMMDIPILYFALAFFHSFKHKNKFWAVLNLGVFASSKSFSPPQVVLIIIFIAVIYFIVDRAKLKKELKNILPVVLGGALVCCLFLARSSYVSLERAGTPLSPFATCKIIQTPACDGLAGEIIRDSGQKLEAMKDAFGNGRGVTAFLKHLWLVAVPTHGVNNEFDYPLGLAWLLWVLFFLARLVPSLREKDFSIFFATAIAFWILWWVGSQQARWLYPVILFGWLGSASIIKKINPRLILGVLCLSALMSLFSEFRALKGDLFKAPTTLQAEQEEKASENNVDVLYINKPVLDHIPGDRRWILR